MPPLESDGFQCRIELDSLAPCGKRLTTVVIRYPRFIHSEVLTHRDRARNSASSRAIPWPKMMAAITEDPVVPIRFGSEQKGMQTGGEVENVEEARRIWMSARDDAVFYAQQLADLGVHKSICNRLTEPFMWITVVMTATEWNNFFRLRCHTDAEIHFQKIAGMIREALGNSIPKVPEEVCLTSTNFESIEQHSELWHLPFVAGHDLDDVLADFSMDDIKRISAARCARVSYLTHEGIHDPKKDLELFNRLANGSGFGHWSPMEHVAMALDTPDRSGPFIGWKQFRKEFHLENSEG